MTPEAVRILVLSDRRASPDGGEHFHNYVAGQVYAGGTVPPMSADLAAEALREGWGERCAGDVDEDASRAGAHDVHAPAPAREAPAGPGTVSRETALAECVWCGETYARRTSGGKPQRFCSPACRRACHAAARRWAVAELEAGRLTVETVLGRA